MNVPVEQVEQMHAQAAVLFDRFAEELSGGDSEMIIKHMNAAILGSAVLTHVHDEPMIMWPRYFADGLRTRGLATEHYDIPRKRARALLRVACASFEPAGTYADKELLDILVTRSQQ